MGDSVSRFWREIPQRYNLIGIKCENCHKVYFPQVDICPHCRRSSLGKMQLIKLKGEGKVITYTIIHVAPEGFEGQAPYAMAIIELDEGPRITAQIIDCDVDKVEIGMKVKSTFRKIRQDGKSGAIYYGYKFRIVE